MSDISQINNNFVHSYLDYASQNSLMALLAGDLKKIEFILRIAKDAFITLDSHSNRFEPNPLIYFRHIYPDDRGIETLTKEDIINFFRIVNNIQEFFAIIRRGITSAESSDNDVIQHLCRSIPNGLKFIKLLYFFIFTNSIAFSSIRVEGIDSKCFLFKISHGEAKENEFYSIDGESKILFHGTSLINLYSIMRNGIKTMSGGKYQSNGAAYGNGIYLTDNFHTAIGYGTTSNSRYGLGSTRLSSIKSKSSVDDSIDDGITSESTCILVFNCKRLNRQGGGFCYVQQENEVILRCIFLIDKTMALNDDVVRDTLIAYATMQSSKYIPPQVYVPTPLSLSSLSISSDLIRINDLSREPRNGDRIIQTKRFIKENERLSALIVEGDQTIIKMNFLNPDDKHSPLLFLLFPDPDTDLGKDLKRYNIPGIKVALYFPAGTSVSEEYPNVPFKIRVISPKFIDGTGRVTKGGSLCADILYKEGWSPTNTIEKILRNLIVSIATEGSRNGPGRIDPNRLGEEYSYAAYLESFSQTAGFHGYTST